MKLLFIGDIVGQPGRRAVRELLPALRAEHGIGFVVANGENSAGGASARATAPRTASKHATIPGTRRMIPLLFP